MAANNHAHGFGLWERILRSRLARGVCRIHVGFASVRSWAADVRRPHTTSIHLFDCLLYRMTDRAQSFEDWVKERELLSP